MVLRDRLAGLLDVRGDRDQLEILGADLLLVERLLSDPLHHPVPVILAIQDDREVLDLAGLDEGQRLEQLVERPESNRKDDEALRVLHEHDRAHAEVAELHAEVDVLVQPLLEGELDVGADGQAAGLLRPTVGGLHDAGPATGDDREALLDERRGQPPSRAVVAVAPADAGRAEDADRRSDLRQRVEALDELAHDAQRSPRIGLLERDRRLPRPEQLLVLGALVAGALSPHHDGTAATLRLLLPAGHWLLSRSTRPGTDGTVTVPARLLHRRDRAGRITYWVDSIAGPSQARPPPGCPQHRRRRAARATRGALCGSRAAPHSRATAVGG